MGRIAVGRQQYGQDLRLTYCRDRGSAGGGGDPAHRAGGEGPHRQPPQGGRARATGVPAAGVLPPKGLPADREQGEETDQVLWRRAAAAQIIPQEPWLREVRGHLRGGKDRDAGAALPFRRKAGEARDSPRTEDQDLAGSQDSLQPGRTKLQCLHPIVIQPVVKFRINKLVFKKKKKKKKKKS